MEIWLIILIFVVLIGFVGIVAVALAVGWKLTHPPRKEVAMTPESFSIYEYENVQFISHRDHIALRGWYMQAGKNGGKSNGYTIIFAHGYSQNRLEPHLPALSLAVQMLASGYDILMFDFRNAGLSSGNITTVGLKEQNDLIGAIDYVASHYPSQKVILLGFSMGAATSLLVAGQDRRVQAVIADSPFYSLEGYLRENLPKWTGLPAVPFNWLIMTLVPWLLRADLQEVQPCVAVTAIAPRPILLIHGTDDEVTPHDNSCRLHELADNVNTELWLVSGAGHVRSYASRPDEYAIRVQQFLQQHLLKK